MKVKLFIKHLQNLKPELQEKDIEVIGQNGLLFPAVIKFNKKDKYDMSLTKENVESVVITD